jgi:hypothetical protein
VTVGDLGVSVHLAGARVGQIGAENAGCGRGWAKRPNLSETGARSRETGQWRCSTLSRSELAARHADRGRDACRRAGGPG